MSTQEALSRSNVVSSLGTEASGTVVGVLAFAGWFYSLSHKHTIKRGITQA